MNKKCLKCGKIAVYWHSIKKIVICHACMKPATGKQAKIKGAKAGNKPKQVTGQKQKTE